MHNLTPEWIPIKFPEGYPEGKRKFILTDGKYIWLGSNWFDFWEEGTHWMPYPALWIPWLDDFPKPTEYPAICLDEYGEFQVLFDNDDPLWKMVRPHCWHPLPEIPK